VRLTSLPVLAARLSGRVIRRGPKIAKTDRPDRDRPRARPLTRARLRFWVRLTSGARLALLARLPLCDRGSILCGSGVPPLSPNPGGALRDRRRRAPLSLRGRKRHRSGAPSPARCLSASSRQGLSHPDLDTPRASEYLRASGKTRRWATPRRAPRLLEPRAVRSAGGGHRVCHSRRRDVPARVGPAAHARRCPRECALAGADP
jgi:hypothetical protein